ncbi:hemagglutinin protein [Dokdonia sp.]|uniref:hemagglutinin protein n=1 Tax=Dokdonia sp. TaxID=2024995 RepID=UPI00326686DF
MIKCPLIFMVLAMVCITHSYGQSIERSVIASSGSTITNGTTTLDFTVGELAVTTITDGTTTFTQGFQQAEVNLAIQISPIVFLQGAFTNPNTGEEMLMRDDLRIASTILIPTTSPYDSTTCDAAIFTTSGTNAIVDWILIELRDATNPVIIIASQSALLQRDGDIVATDGTSAVSIDVTSGDYYVAVKHRNHLGILTASTLALSRAVTTLDLSTDVAVATGGSLALRDMGNGLYAMYAGDVNNDGSILNTDITNAIAASGGITVYTGADADMDGNILNTDIALIIQPNAGRIQQF